MIFLAIDTSTERLIVATRETRPERVDRVINLDSQGNHARELIAAVSSVLDGRIPDAVGINLGPGSFTGLRIGLATAKGLAQGWKVPLVGLDGLASMAAAYRILKPSSTAPLLPIIDARKQKFYGSLFGRDALLLKASDLSPADWLAEATRLCPGEVAVTGYQGHVLQEALGGLFPAQWSVLSLQDWNTGLLDQTEEGFAKGQVLSPDAGPRYLRLSEAEENLRASRTPFAG